MKDYGTVGNVWNPLAFITCQHEAREVSLWKQPEWQSVKLFHMHWVASILWCWNYHNEFIVLEYTHKLSCDVVAILSISTLATILGVLPHIAFIQFYQKRLPTKFDSLTWNKKGVMAHWQCEDLGEARVFSPFFFKTFLCLLFLFANSCCFRSQDRNCPLWKANWCR